MKWTQASLLIVALFGILVVFSGMRVDARGTLAVWPVSCPANNERSPVLHYPKDAYGKDYFYKIGEPNSRRGVLGFRVSLTNSGTYEFKILSRKPFILGVSFDTFDQGAGDKISPGSNTIVDPTDEFNHYDRKRFQRRNYKRYRDKSGRWVHSRTYVHKYSTKRTKYGLPHSAFLDIEVIPIFTKSEIQKAKKKNRRPRSSAMIEFSCTPSKATQTTKRTQGQGSGAALAKCWRLAPKTIVGPMRYKNSNFEWDSDDTHFSYRINKSYQTYEFRYDFMDRFPRVICTGRPFSVRVRGTASCVKCAGAPVDTFTIYPKGIGISPKRAFGLSKHDVRYIRYKTYIFTVGLWSPDQIKIQLISGKGSNNNRTWVYERKK